MRNPKIRFKGYADTWEQRKLGDVCERLQGNDGRMDLPTLTISAANGWMRQEDRFSSNIAGKEQKNYTLLHKGELSYNHGNSKLAKYGTVFSLEIYEEALVPRVYHSFRMTKGVASFIEYYFATKIPDRELAKLISSGARMDGLLNIGFDEFMGINIKLPSVCEQEKISEYFRNLDHLITLHQRKCEEIKTLKKFMLQKMFPQNGENVPEIRFDGFTNAWEQRKLSDEVSSIDTGKSKFDAKESGDYEILGSTGVIGYDDSFDYEGDFLLTARVGANAGTLYRHSGKVKITDNTVFLQGSHIDFAFYLLDKFDLKKMSFGSGQPLIKASELKCLELMMPVQNEEKEKIATYFLNLDHLITLHQRKCDELQSIKKFMLQNMFV
ncbi:MAG: restriction endonuclease subunit S [Lachnospiraceae bacterium]|nr:restriction endonuclease subunit S [Lachnospiraceae bacterium]